jgi:rare lipoprotein A
MIKYNLRRPGVCLAAAVAFGSLVSATPGLADIPSAGSVEATNVDDPLPIVEVAAPPIIVPDTLPAELAEPSVAEVVEEGFEHIGDGEASYYGYELAGNRTASGERFDPKAMTAAHRTLPLGTKLRVINKTNGKSVIVRINDRGPFVKKRLIDISLGAAQAINMVRAGKAMVRLERLR